MTAERCHRPLGTVCCNYIAAPGVAPDSVEFATAHREWHLLRWPNTDHSTRQVLVRLIASAEKRGAVRS